MIRIICVPLLLGSILFAGIYCNNKGTIIETGSPQKDITGIWSFDGNSKSILQLLGLSFPSYIKRGGAGLYCMDFAPEQEYADIQFEVDKKPYRVSVKKISEEKYQLIYKARSIVMDIKCKYDKDFKETTCYSGVNNSLKFYKYTADYDGIHTKTMFASMNACIDSSREMANHNDYDQEATQK